MRLVGSLLLALFWVTGSADAAETAEYSGWKRIDSRYTTIWLHPSLEARKVNKKISIWRVRPKSKPQTEGETPEGELAYKLDILFRRAQEILDMYPPGVRTTLRIAPSQSDIKEAHDAHYGQGTPAAAFYVFEKNTIYATVVNLSESILAHEMAHCIIDHYFRARPPRKVEELLAMHVDSHLRE